MSRSYVTLSVSRSYVTRLFEVDTDFKNVFALKTFTEQNQNLMQTKCTKLWLTLRQLKANVLKVRNGRSEEKLEYASEKKQCFLFFNKKSDDLAASDGPVERRFKYDVQGSMNFENHMWQLKFGACKTGTVQIAGEPCTWHSVECHCTVPHLRKSALWSAPSSVVWSLLLRTYLLVLNVIIYILVSRFDWARPMELLLIFLLFSCMCFWQLCTSGHSVQLIHWI